jgi:AraC-like DNA-binding protein
MKIQDKFKHLPTVFLPQERRVISFENDGIADVEAMGRYEYHTVKPGLDLHAHDHAIEFCYLARGCQTYRLQGREYRLVGGDIFVAPPGVPHDTGAHPEDCGVLYWLILRLPRRGGTLLKLCSKDSAEICRRLVSLPQPHFVGRPVLKQIFDRLFELYDDLQSPLRSLEIRHELLCCILEVLRCSDKTQCRRQSRDIARAVQYIESSPEEEFSLSELADKAGLSLSRFKVKFKLETGIAPREFILRTKVDEAKKALVDNRASVTETAMRLGFSSSQYFATVFKRFTQQSPRDYREWVAGVSEPRG